MDSSMLLCVKYNRVLITLLETCNELGITLGTAYNMVNARRFPIPYRKQGRKIFVDVRDLGEYFDEQRKVAKEIFNS
jgi:hypothetical protein